MFSLLHEKLDCRSCLAYRNVAGEVLYATLSLYLEKFSLKVYEPYKEESTAIVYAKCFWVKVSDKLYACLWSHR